MQEAQETVKPCFECGAPADYSHYVVPQSRGGTKTVALCAMCYGLAHERQAQYLRNLRVSYGHRSPGGSLRIETDAAKQRAIAQAHSDRDAGKSLRQIGQHLEDLGILPPRGGSWHAETIRRMLSAEVVSVENFSEKSTSPQQ